MKVKKLIANHSKKVISAPKVSIIIPVYNTPENLLRDCLESAKNQTLKDIEIICVDDGATDGSGKILDEYAKSDPRFKVVHQKNKGLSGARNKGIDMARGEYIKFLDSDDMIDAVAAEKSYNVAKKHDADIVRYGTKDLERGMGAGLCCDRLQVIDYEKSGISTLWNIFREKKFHLTAWGGLYRNRFLQNNNLKFFEKIKRVCEEQFFNIICCSRRHKTVWMPDKMYVYRNNPTSIMSSPSMRTDMLNSFKCGIVELYNYWKSEGLLNDVEMKVDCLRFTLNSLFKLLMCSNSLNKFLVNVLLNSELLQDDIVIQLTVSEKIQLKMLMLRANMQANPQKTLDDGIYIISSKLDPNKCLAMKDSNKDNSANLQLLSRNGTNSQKFKISYHSDGCYTIQSLCSGKILDVAASGKKKWFIVIDEEKYCYLVPKCSNLCMDVCGGKAKNGANIHCEGMHGGDSQRFKFEKCEVKKSS